MKHQKHIEKMYDIDPQNFAFAGWVVWHTEQREINGQMVSEIVPEIDVADGYTDEQVFECNEYGKCEHCGRNITHWVAVHDLTSDTIIPVGFTCYNEVFAHGDREALDLHQAKKQAERAAHNAKIARDVEKFRASHEELCNDLQDAQIVTGNRFLSDLWRKLHQYGSLTDKQVAAAERSISQIKDRQAQEPEVWVNAPEGRIDVTGQILAIKNVESFYGTQTKMLVKVEADGGHWKLWTTYPSSLYGQWDDEAEAYTDDAEKGDVIKMTVTVEPSDDDPFFAFGKRPTKATVMTYQAEVV